MQNLLAKLGGWSVFLLYIISFLVTVIYFFQPTGTYIFSLLVLGWFALLISSWFGFGVYLILNGE